MELGAREGDDEAARGGGEAQDRVEDREGERPVLGVREAAHRERKDRQAKGRTDWQENDVAKVDKVGGAREGGAEAAEEGGHGAQ